MSFKFKQRPKGSSPLVHCYKAPCPVHGLAGQCLIYVGHRNHGGYGRARVRDKLVLVHRYAWENTRGPIPEGMVIDHRCRVRACCNVQHLRLVTRVVNGRENSVSPAAANYRKKCCKHGHRFTPSNTAQHDRHGGRRCVACDQSRQTRRLNGRPRNRDKTHCPAGHEYTPENTYRSSKGRACRTCQRLRGRAAYLAKVGRLSGPAVGEKNGGNKYPAKLIRKILRLAGTMSQDSIAFKTGVAQSHVSRIIRGEAWKRITANHHTRKT